MHSLFYAANIDCPTCCETRSLESIETALRSEYPQNSEALAAAKAHGEAILSFVRLPSHPSPTERPQGHQHRSPSRLFSCAATIGAAAFVRMAEDIPSNQAAWVCQLYAWGLKYLTIFSWFYQCMHLARRIQFTTVDEAQLPELSTSFAKFVTFSFCCLQLFHL